MAAPTDKRLKIFVCYQRKSGDDVASEFYTRLSRLGANVFLDIVLLGPGDWKEQIDRFIIRCDCFLIVLTSTTLNSAQVRREIELAQSYGRLIIPLTGRGFRFENLSDDLKWLGDLQSFPFEPLSPAVDWLKQKLSLGKSRISRMPGVALGIITIIVLLLVSAVIIQGVFQPTPHPAATATVPTATSVLIGASNTPPPTLVPTLTATPPMLFTITPSQLSASPTLTSTMTIVTTTPTATPTQSPTITVNSTIATRGYPCDATVQDRAATFLEVVRAEPNNSSSPINSIQPRQHVSIRDKAIESQTYVWYYIADTNDHILGWVIASYLKPSAQCPE